MTGLNQEIETKFEIERKKLIALSLEQKAQLEQGISPDGEDYSRQTSTYNSFFEGPRMEEDNTLWY